jgi:protein-disulfide isomerase
MSYCFKILFFIIVFAYGNNISPLSFASGTVQSKAEGLAPEEELNGKQAAVLHKHTVMDHYLGANPFKAKVVVVAYSSPTCTHCANFYQASLPKLKQKYLSGENPKVSYIYRSFTMNWVDLKANLLLYCKERSNQDFFAVITTLYETQADWAFTNFYESRLSNMFAIHDGASAETLTSCLNDRVKQKEFSRQRIDLVRKGGLKGTPQFVVNGKVLDSPSAELLIKEIDKALAAK